MGEPIHLLGLLLKEGVQRRNISKGDSQVVSTKLPSECGKYVDPEMETMEVV